MTRAEYIRQFPGLENRAINELDCPREYGLDEDKCGCGCHGCFDKEATIDGKQAPSIFACPVKPGQKVYELHWELSTGIPYVKEVGVYQVVFTKDGTWRADMVGIHSFDESRWMKLVFPTMEAAEDRLKEMKGN